MLHKKNPDVGTKQVLFSNEIYLEYDDVKDMAVGEEVTLMDWGNAFVTALTPSGDSFSVEMKLNLEGDFKKTKKKLTWLSVSPDVLPVKLVDFDYLISKKKLEEEDELSNFITPVTKFETVAVGDSNLKALKKGDIIQFERKGYYIYDGEEDGHRVFLLIPDGKKETSSSKADTSAAEPPKKEEKAAKKQKSDKTQKQENPLDKIIYKIKPVCGTFPKIDPTKVSKMYVVKPFQSFAQSAEEETAVAGKEVTSFLPC